MKLKLLSPSAKVPVRSTPGSSCWDVFAAEAKFLMPGARALIKLGFSVEVMPGTELQIRPRSGLALRHGILCHLGTIDSDYRGEVGAIIFNLSDTGFNVNVGDRIAQMALCSLYGDSITLATDLSETERGAGGFGHTGV